MLGHLNSEFPRLCSHNPGNLGPLGDSLLSGLIKVLVKFATSLTTYNTTKPKACGGFIASRVSSGNHIGKVTPVPIPNTVDKLSEPMIVPKVRK